MFFIFPFHWLGFLLGFCALAVAFILNPILTIIGIILFVIVVWNIFKTPPPAA